MTVFGEVNKQTEQVRSSSCCSLAELSAALSDVGLLRSHCAAKRFAMSHACLFFLLHRDLPWAPH